MIPMAEQNKPGIGAEFGLDLASGKAHFFTNAGPVTHVEKKHFELIFLNILTQAKESLFNPEVQDLFAKMKSAMKLQNIQVIELDCTVDNRSELPSELAEKFESKIVVVFSSFPKDMSEMIYKGPGKWLETYSPAYLLEDPTAKKAVWNDLQKVMRELGV
ncbi:hypothetical protein D3C87_124720 [compost metagenome]